MRVIVCGSRRREPSDEDIERALTEAKLEVTMLVCGMAPGVDLAAYAWARRKGLFIDEHPAMWSIHGDRAGPVRNAEMVRVAQACVAFPCPLSKGTWDCVKKAKAAGLPTLVSTIFLERV